MKTLLTIISVLIFASVTFAQKSEWTTLLYEQSSGPVSPEYQYEYKVNINADGISKLIYTNSSGSDEYDFKIPSNKGGMKKLKKALKSSGVMKTPVEEMKSENMLIGGKSRKLTITLWQDPKLDQMPLQIIVPEQVKDEYKPGIDRLYETIISLIPKDIKSKTGITQ